MRLPIAVLVLGMTSAAVGCARDDGDSTLERCLEDMLTEEAVVQRQYRNGELDGIEESFLDLRGANYSIIIAEARIRERDDECDEAIPQQTVP